MQPETTSGVVAEGEAAGRQPALLDARDVAAMLKCSRRTICRLMDAGRIPAPIRLGGLLRWDRRALLEWITQGCPPCRSGRSR